MFKAVVLPGHVTNMVIIQRQYVTGGQHHVDIYVHIYTVFRHVFRNASLRLISSSRKSNQQVTACTGLGT